MSFAAPAWLLGLLLVPLIWYVHRSGPILRRHPVSSVLLWRRSEQASLAAGTRPRPDPAWLWRAAVAVLLSIALAGPRLVQDSAPVTIWIDDSLSMQTIEDGRSRLEAGLAQARAALDPRQVDTVVLRKLSRPWQALTMRDSIAVDVAARESSLPPGELLDSARAHWLVTDGTDAELDEWLRAAPIERIIQVGAIRRNVGIVHVAARREPEGGDRVAVAAVMANGGDIGEQRTLTLDVGGAALVSRAIDVEPGTSRTVAFALDALPDRLRLRLDPADALAHDDAAELDLTPLLPLRVAIDETCPAAIVRAVDAHPALERAASSAADLQFVCAGTALKQPKVPTIWFAAGPTRAIAIHELTWAEGLAAARQVDTNSLPQQVRGRLDPLREGDRIVLATGAEALIVRRNVTPRLVEVTLDMESPSIGGQRELPLLVALLADAATDRALIGPLATMDRGLDAARVVPRGKLTASGNARPLATTTAPLDVRPLLALALLLLMWDAWTLLRRFLRDRGELWTPAA